MFDGIRGDWRAHDCQWTRHGFWALLIYRFGRWRYGIQPRVLRLPFSFLYKVLKFFADALLGLNCRVKRTSAGASSSSTSAAL